MLRLARIARPEIADDEVLVRVRAAGLDRGTWHVMAGRPYLLRVIGFGFRRPKSRVAGLDVAGTVAAVGPAVTGSRPATRCSASPRAPSPSTPPSAEDKLPASRPNLTFEQAAVVPIPRAPRCRRCDAGRVQAGQRVLIIGASGGVG